MKTSKNYHRLTIYLMNASHSKNFTTTQCYREVESLERALEILNMVAKSYVIKMAYYSGKLISEGSYWKGGLIDTLNNQGKLIIA